MRLCKAVILSLVLFFSTLCSAQLNTARVMENEGEILTFSTNHSRYFRALVEANKAARQITRDEMNADLNLKAAYDNLKPIVVRYNTVVRDLNGYIKMGGRLLNYASYYVY
jgi:hypothetical protein